MKPSYSIVRGPIALLGILICVGLGCRGRPPAPADPARAHEALQLILNAWQQGDTPESLKQRDRSIVAIDPEWRSGARLIAYKVDSDDRIGAEMRCQVTLSVLKNGKTVQKKAFYNVGTNPVLTVVREEEQ
jgi:hypothetical protein